MSDTENCCAPGGRALHIARASGELEGFNLARAVPAMTGRFRGLCAPSSLARPHVSRLLGGTCTFSRVGSSKTGWPEVAEDTHGELAANQHPPDRNATPTSGVSTNELAQLTQLMSSRLEVGLKQVSLAAWRDTTLEPVAEGLRHVVASEGIERIIDELRRAPAFAALEGGMIAIEVDPVADPAQTYIHWQDRMPAEFEARMRSVAARDPSRPFQNRLPVGLAFDLRDIADKALLASSEAYTSIYESLDDSWVTVVLERTPTATWLLTCWHRVTEESHRVHLRTALQRLAGPLRLAFHRIGLFGEVLPPSPEVKFGGILRAGRRRSIRGGVPHPDQDERNDFSSSGEFAIVASSRNHFIVKNAETPALAEWSLEELKAERERLTLLLEQVDKWVAQKFGIADAVPVRELRHGVRLVDRFETDSRPLLIYVEGTERRCLLRPAGPSSGFTDTVPISSLSQYGSDLARRVAEDGQRIGIRRGRGRTERVVAELVPANDVPVYLISVLLKKQNK